MQWPRCRIAPCSLWPHLPTCSCIWRFTQDDVAAAQDGAEWRCLLCRPAPKLHLAYIQERAGSSSSDRHSGSCGGSDGREADAEHAAALAAGLRRSTRQRTVRTCLQQQRQHAAGSDPDSLIIELTDSEAEEQSGADWGGELQQGAARAQSRARSQPPASARRRGDAGAARQAPGAAARRPRAAAAAAETAPAAEPVEPAADGPPAQHPAAQQAGGSLQAMAGRKRHRRLLPQRDIQSPSEDAEAQHMRRMQQQRQQRRGQLGAGRGQLQALQQSQRQSQEEKLRRLML